MPRVDSVAGPAAGDPPDAPSRAGARPRCGLCFSHVWSFSWVLGGFRPALLLNCFGFAAFATSLMPYTNTPRSSPWALATHKHAKPYVPESCTRFLENSFSFWVIHASQFVVFSTPACAAKHPSGRLGLVTRFWIPRTPWPHLWLGLFPPVSVALESKPSLNAHSLRSLTPLTNSLTH